MRNDNNLFTRICLTETTLSITATRHFHTRFKNRFKQSNQVGFIAFLEKKVKSGLKKTNMMVLEFS